MNVPAIFISYRRDDSNSEALLLRDALNREFGGESAFLDSSSLHAGVRWPDELQERLRKAEIVLAVIGPDWLRAGGDEWGRRRIDNEQDCVRQELSMALTKNKRVIPVLVRGGRIPPVDVLPEPINAIPNYQAIEIRRDYWDHDVKLLLAQIAREPSGRDERGDLTSAEEVFLEIGADGALKQSHTELRVLVKEYLVSTDKSKRQRLRLSICPEMMANIVSDIQALQRLGCPSSSEIGARRQFLEQQSNLPLAACGVNPILSDGISRMGAQSK